MPIQSSTAIRDLSAAARSQPHLALWLTYLRQRLGEIPQNSRLGLVLGAGVSTDANIPMWPDLVTRLTEAVNIDGARIDGHRNAGHPETFIAEIIFRTHSRKQAEENHQLSWKYQRFVVDSSWRQEIHKCLYQDVANKPFEEITRDHVYLSPLARLICNAGFAVTFNFDDIVDEAVLDLARDSQGLNPEIITAPKIETRKNAPTIYHINGYLPREELRRASEKIVLTEDAFADILLSPNSQDAEFVINQFATKTFLLIGISLSDSSLKNLLRSGAKRNPANHHFIIYHEKDGEPRPQEVRDDLFDVNLHVYNLISIFLTTEEIKTFIETLNLRKGDDFEASISGILTAKVDRKYYLVGAVSAGKSSVLEALRCFQTFEEWSGRAPPEMYLDDRTLTQEQQHVVDEFLFPQLISKNNRMASVQSGPCIRIMDRAFFDLFAFSRGPDEVFRKGSELQRRFAALGKHFEDGQVFLLTASKEAFNERMARRGIVKVEGGKKTFDGESLIRQEGELRRVYRPAEADIFDTTDEWPGDLAKKIARRILLGNYAEFGFKTRLDEIVAQKGVL